MDMIPIDPADSPLDLPDNWEEDIASAVEQALRRDSCQADLNILKCSEPADYVLRRDTFQVDLSYLARF